MADPALVPDEDVSPIDGPSVESDLAGSAVPTAAAASRGPAVSAGPALKAKVSSVTTGGRRWLRRALEVVPAVGRGAPATGAAEPDVSSAVAAPERDGSAVEANPAGVLAAGAPPDAAADWTTVGAPGAPPVISAPGPVAPAPALRRGVRRPDLSGLQEMRSDPSGGRTPDWMAKRIVEREAPGAAYELGKPRRWRRRKITVLRSRTDRRLIRRIDTWTVFKLSLIFYLLMVVIILVAGTATWNVAEHLGFIDDIQKSVRSLADDKKFVFHGKVALRYSAYGGIALGLLGTVFNTVAAMLYNLLSDVFGGLQVIVVTEPD